MALDPVLEVNADKVMIWSDVHCPMQSGPWIHQGMLLAEKLGIKHLHINGDFLDCNQISRHAGSYYRRKAELNDDFDAAEALLKLAVTQFSSITLCVGNHDARLIQRFGGELSAQRMFKMLGNFPQLTITPRSFITINKDVWAVHPRQYSSIRGGLPQKLAQRHGKHIVCGHEHHSAATSSPDGKWQACDVGCMADTELMDYIRNEVNTYAEPVNGFAVVIGTNIVLFDQFTPWQIWGLPPVLAKL